MRRTLSAVLAADVVGYSTLMGADAEGTLDTLRRLQAALETPMTTPWLRRATDFSKLRSFIAEAHGAALKRWNTLPSNGSIGSTIAAFPNPSETFGQQKQRRTLTLIWKLGTWPRNLYQPASGKPGTVQTHCRSEVRSAFAHP